MTGHINYKGVNVMKNKKKTAGILLLTCILGAVLIFVPKYIFSAVKTSMDTYSNKKEAMKEDHWVYNDSGKMCIRDRSKRGPEKTPSLLSKSCP